MGIVEGEGGGDGHLFWIMLLVGVGLKSSGDPGRDFSCWELLLQGLLVGLGRGGDGWSWGELGVGACGRVGLGVGLNSWGEELWLVYSKLLVRGMHGVTDRASLNWLLGVSCTVLVLSSVVDGGGGSDRISGEVIGSSA